MAINLQAVEPSRQTLDPLRPLRGNELAIVGFDESTREQAPFDNEDVEIWICNRLGIQPFVKRWDRHADPHPLDWSANNHDDLNWSTYKEWLERDYGEALIYVPKPEPDVVDVPNAVPYPLEAVVGELGRYFCSVIGWQLGLALYLHALHGRPTKIGLYGCDMRARSEYDYQRPNVEHLLGIAKGRGIEVYVPPESALLNSDGRSPLYGFELYSGDMGEMERAMDKRAKDLKDEFAKAKAEQARIEKHVTVIEGQWKELTGWHERVAGYRRGGTLY